MTSRIHILDDSLISKIAAGEVIERPSSIVKELVENAVDAQATHIHVDIQQGGRRSITLLDDGFGMTQDEVLLALKRHATSKISTLEDLYHIQTLGFRGEALPSIASVSMMTLMTRAREPSQVTGTRVDIEGGRVLKVGDCASAEGTKIVVENVFFNTPARLKFLKSPETEFSHIDTVVEQMALAHPEIGFQLTHNGKKTLSCPLRQDLRQRIHSLYGALIVDQCLSVTGENQGFKMSGLVGRPSLHHGSARNLFFFVNGRAVKDRTLHHAVLTAYETLLMRGRYPEVFLFLELPTDQVDVNVHPAKLEVRFAQSTHVHRFVVETLKRHLQNQGGISVRMVGDPSAAWGDPRGGTPSVAPSFQQPLLGDERGRTPMTPLKIVGQIHETYLLCELPDKLIFVDQHAAHERIGFEALKRQYEAKKILSQRLLVPEIFELKPSLAEILRYYLEDLRRWGLDIDSYGDHAFAIKAVPLLLEDTRHVELVQDLVESMASYELLQPLEKRWNEVLETMACHRQVRAGDLLSPQEIWALLEEMKKTPRAMTCPHGRPVIVEVMFEEVERWFKRKK